MPTLTSTDSPWRGVTRNTISPVVSAWPLISMRHLLAVGDASAKAMAASISEEATAVEMAPSFMETPVIDFCGVNLRDAMPASAASASVVGDRA